MLCSNNFVESIVLSSPSVSYIAVLAPLDPVHRSRGLVIHDKIVKAWVGDSKAANKWKNLSHALWLRHQKSTGMDANALG